jgi:hypothetical protein
MQKKLFTTRWPAHAQHDFHSLDSDWTTDIADLDDKGNCID